MLPWPREEKTPVSQAGALPVLGDVEGTRDRWAPTQAEVAGMDTGSGVRVELGWGFRHTPAGSTGLDEGRGVAHPGWSAGMGRGMGGRGGGGSRETHRLSLGAHRAGRTGRRVPVSAITHLCI